MSSLGYFEKILNEYQRNFDIYRDYEVNSEIVDAYGYFCSQSEKYLLVREVQLWETQAFEHVFFIRQENLDEIKLEKFLSIIPDYIEPKLIRKGEKYPEKNHMYSYITLVFLTDDMNDTQVKNRIEKYKFERSYLFSVRGYVQSRVVLVDMKNKEIITNKMGRKLRKLYKHFL